MYFTRQNWHGRFYYICSKRYGMRALFVLAISLILICPDPTSAQIKGPSHELWGQFLKKYVSPYGNVNYEAISKDDGLLNQYLDVLNNNHPNTAWSNDEQIAYWINAYNAYTIKLIIDHYPVNSIRDIKDGDKDAWHIPFIEIGGKTYTLDDIENTMLRGQFNDARVHFAINCASISCPPLWDEAYTADRIQLDLKLAAKKFINDSRYNILSANHVQVSKIFEWYAKDFINEENSVLEYLNKYTSRLEISKTASLSYFDYNWGLNKQK